MEPQDYVHRIGRTGRAGVEGEAISLVCVDEARLMRDIEAILGHRIPTEIIEGFEPNPAIRPEAIRLRMLGPAAVGRGRVPQGRAAVRAPDRTPNRFPSAADRRGRPSRPSSAGPSNRAAAGRGVVVLPGERLARAAAGR